MCLHAKIKVLSIATISKHTVGIHITSGISLHQWTISKAYNKLYVFLRFKCTVVSWVIYLGSSDLMFLMKWLKSAVSHYN